MREKSREIWQKVAPRGESEEEQVSRVDHDDRRCARLRRSTRLALAVLGLMVVLPSTATAAAKWRIDAVSNTTVAPGRNHQYFLQFGNVGDQTTSGDYTLRIRLPDGVTGVSVTATGPLSCPSVAGETLIECTGSTDLSRFDPRYPIVTVAVSGAASGTLTSEFEISGGSAGTAGAADSTKVSASPPAFGVEAFDAHVTDSAGNGVSQAGGRPFEGAFSIDFNTLQNPDFLRGPVWPVEPTKNVLVNLPPGVVGNPTVAERCTVADLANGYQVQVRSLCSPASQVGVAWVRLNGGFIGSDSAIGPVAVYNMVAPPDAPAQFAFNVLGSIVTLKARLRSESDYGLSVDVLNVPEALPIAGTTLALWGVPADRSHDHERACRGQVGLTDGGPSCISGSTPKSFLRNPTSCPAPGTGLVTRARVDSWTRPGQFVEAETVSHDPPGYPLPPGAPHGPDNCAGVPFRPRMAAQPVSGSKGNAPAGFTFDLTIPQNDDPNGISQSDLRKAVVKLPVGVRLSPGSAQGLAGCSAAQAALRSTADATCPDASKVASVTIETPLLDEPLTGAVYLATPFDNPFNKLIALYIVVRGPGVTIKLPGQTSLDPDTGQITAIFDDNPQLPFSKLHLEFKGGPRAPLVLPKKCGTYTTEAVMEGWSGAIATDSSSFTVTEDAKGRPCPSVFGPRFEAGTTNPVAGRSSTFLLRLTREDEDQELQALTVNLPTGLLGRIASVDLCGNAEANAGTCGEGSRVGRVTVGAGAGSSPFYIDAGRAYLTGPYKGAPFGLSIVVPAVAGPFNLGTVVVRSALFVDRYDARVRVVSDPLPTVLEGIPLDVRDVRVAIDRDGFFLNPTSCAEKTIGGVIASTEGATANVSTRFQAADCARLPLRPKMTLQVGGRGRTGRGGSTPFIATLRQTPGQAALRFVRVTLPTTITARLTVINDACTRAEYDSASRECERARTGSAIAKTPLLRDELRGNVYFVRNGNPLPDLFVRLRGQVDFDLVGRITIPGSKRLRTTFDAVPDVPISSFQLRLVAGKDGSIGTATNLCSRRGRTAKAELDFRGQNGKVVQLDQRLTIRGCNRSSRGGRRGGRGRRR